MVWLVKFILQSFNYIKQIFHRLKPCLLDLHLSILDRFISCKIYDKRDDFDFEIVNFPDLDGDVLVEHPTVFIYRN